MELPSTAAIRCVGLLAVTMSLHTGKEHWTVSLIISGTRHGTSL